MLVSPRLAVVAVACAAVVLVPVGIASAGTTPSPTDPAPTAQAPAPSPSLEGAPSPTDPPAPAESTPAPGPGVVHTLIPLPSASSRAVPSPQPAPTSPDRAEPTEPNDGVAPAVGQVDEYLRLSAVADSLQRSVAAARASLARADRAVTAASGDVVRASLGVSIAGLVDRTADGEATDVVRELYQQGDGGVADLATVMTLGPNGLLERLYNLRAMRGAATQVVRSAEQAELDLEVAKVARTTAVARLRTAVAARDDAALVLRRAQRELVNADAQLARLGLVAPQVQIGPDGCPTADVPATLRDGAELIGARTLCTAAVTKAATAQAALAVTWAFQHLGAAYACGGSGRMLPFRADCSSFVSRAYAEGAGLRTAGDSWAPSTRTMVPWDGVALDPHYAEVAPAALRPGDLVLYDTCPQGGCPYKHVVMYLGADTTGAEWMLHTNACGDVAKVERFWGFPTTGPHTFLVARRVLALPGETLRAVARPGPTDVKPRDGASGAIG